MSNEMPQPSQTPNKSEEELQEEVRRSIFATHIAYGSAIPDALAAAGYSSTSLHLGWTLLTYPDVRDMVDRHRQHIAGKASRTVKELIEQLDRDREFAIDTRNAAVATACTMAQAKLLGHLDPSAQVKGQGKRLVITWGGDDAADITPVNVIEMEALPAPAKVVSPGG
jgi:hypothetical protein